MRHHVHFFTDVADVFDPSGLGAVGAYRRTGGGIGDTRCGSRDFESVNRIGGQPLNIPDVSSGSTAPVPTISGAPITSSIFGDLILTDPFVNSIVAEWGKVNSKRQ